MKTFKNFSGQTNNGIANFSNVEILKSQQAEIKGGNIVIIEVGDG